MDGLHIETDLEAQARHKWLRKLQKKLTRRMPEGEDVTFLNITAMMDMMTILLVFFLKNFSVSVANVNLSAELSLPSSTTQIEPHQAVALTVTRDAVLVEDDEVTSVKRGRVDASAKRDGENGFFITPVVDMLEKHKNRLQKLEQLGGKPFEGELIVICDRRTPYRLLSEVIYSAGQAEFGRYRLLLLTKGEGGK